MLSSNLVRQTTPELVNKIVNHPDIYPWVCGADKGPLDVSPIIANLSNYALFTEHGGMIFTCHQPGLYEAHTQFLPEARGKQALETAQEALCWMFCHTDAIEIMTRCPKGNLGAKAMARALHAEFEFRNERGWIFDGNVIPADIYALRIQQWIKTAPWLVECGQWFHHRLEDEYLSAGKKEEIHPDDPVHDRYVGAASAMILGGQVQKGVIFYNRWAVMAGYQPISIVTASPLIIDIRDALLCIKDNSFWMI